MNETLVNNNINPDLKELFNTVVDGGYCIGCGACASLPGSPISIKLDPYKKLQATVDLSETTDDGNSYTKVCPFSNNSLNEDELGKELFPVNTEYDNKLGYFVENYAGHVAEADFRDNGSSGGMGTWILAELLKRSLVDYVIHIHQRAPDAEDPRMFAYSLSTTLEQLKSGSKSRYYPIELSEVMNVVKTMPGKYAIVGIPCFIKTIRLLSNQDPILKERIKYCIGLVCGHLKSASFAEMFGWQIGVNPKNMTAIDFRNKLEGYGANQYGVTVTETINNVSDTKISPPINEMYGTNWGFGFFKYKACDYCDDVLAETADLTVGDAWLPEYVNDTKGTNIVVVRNLELNNIIQESIQAGRLAFNTLHKSRVIESQSSGFNHRREGLQYRLHLMDLKGKWRPIKRVKASGAWPKRFKNIQDARIELAAQSHVAFKEALDKDSFDVFKMRMDPLVKEYRKLYQQPILSRVYRKGMSILNRVISKGK
jgi:coenzyme F420 hydrogenase subunit beta